MDAFAIAPRRAAARALVVAASVALVTSVLALGGIGAGRAAAQVPADVRFSTQPLGVTVGGGLKTGEPNVAWPVQPVVTLTGDWDSAYAYTVTLQIDPSSPNAGGPGHLACTGGTTRDMFNGSAAFFGCRIDAVGTAYQLLATITGTTASGVALPAMQVSSLAFDIAGGIPPLAPAIRFTTQPLGATVGGPRPSAFAGRSWSIQPVVSVVDQTGSVVTSDNQTIILLSISDGAPVTGGPGNLSCASGTVLAVHDGVAAFTGCSIDAPGTAYELTASTYASGSLRVLFDESLDFDVRGGALGARATFTTQPLGAIYGGDVPSAPSGSLWVAPPVVSILDSAGRLVRNDYSTVVTLSIDSQSPPGGTLACAGGISQRVSAGVAAFDGCQVTGPGTGYVLRASARSGRSSLVYDLSLPFTIASVPSGLTIAPSAFTVAPNELLTLVGTLSGDRAAGQSVVFQRQQPGDAGWVDLGTGQTSASGVATLTIDPLFTATYRAVFNGAAGVAAAVSSSSTVAVQAVVTLAPSAPRTVKKGTAITYTARVTPVPAASATVLFLFYTYVGGAWTYSTSTSVPVDASGVATLAWTWGTAGRWYAIATAPTTAYYAQGSSRTVRVTVR